MLCAIAELAVEFDDRDTADEVYRLLSPFADLFNCGGAGVIVIGGSVHLGLDRSAAQMQSAPIVVTACSLTGSFPPIGLLAGLAVAWTARTANARPSRASPGTRRRVRCRGHLRRRAGRRPGVRPGLEREQPDWELARFGAAATGEHAREVGGGDAAGERNPTSAGGVRVHAGRRHHLCISGGSLVRAAHHISGVRLLRPIAEPASYPTQGRPTDTNPDRRPLVRGESSSGLGGG
jgi:hypothetical protein